MLTKSKEYAIALATLAAGLFILSRVTPGIGVKLGLSTYPLQPLSGLPWPFGYGVTAGASASSGGGQTFDSATNF